MADPLLLVADRLADAFAAVAGERVDPVVRPSDRADAQANGALALAKRLGRPPREVAVEVVAQAGPALAALARLEVAGPGFINVTFADEFIAGQVHAAATAERLGVRPTDTPQRVLIDYSGPNVAKEMHVGHLRSTVIGDALVRLFGYVGHAVLRENHIGDWGTPFGMLIEHLLDIGEAEGTTERTAQAIDVGDLDSFYKQARAAFDASDEFKERARQRVVKLQGGDPETLRLWRLLVDESTRYFNRVYGELGVKLVDDDLAGESTYNQWLPVVLARLASAGLLQQSDGADVVFPPGFTNREGDPLPLIVQKGTGGFNYATSDLACLIDRIERRHAEVILYVVDAGQSLHLQMVFAVAEMAGWLKPPVRAEHVAFGIVLDEHRHRLRSRSGDTVKLMDLITEAIERADAAVREKNPELADDERKQVAHAVGVGAVKYADLANDRTKDYVFDWDRMLAFDGNTGPYLQYAHARICSIFRRASIARAAVREVAPRLGEPQERALALRLLGFDQAVHDALDKLAPHRLCSYLYDLATDFTAFYEHCPVLKADDDTRHSRLALCDLTARVLAQGLDLLGIEAPERM